MKKKLLLGVGLATMLMLAACGSTTKTDTEKTGDKEAAHYPLTIENFAKAEGSEQWDKKEQTFDKAPERIMANTRPAAELLLHLGLGDKIVGVGADFGAVDESVATEYAKLPILSSDYVGKEVTLGTNPDLVFGRGGLFDNAEWGVGTVDSLNDMGVKTYVLESSVTGGTYESVYKDIKNLGEIFEVQDKADAFIKELKEKQKTIAGKLDSIKEHKTFAYLHTNDPKELYIYPANGETFFNDAFTMVKLDNVFKEEKGDVSIETLIATDPDVLILPNWDGSDLIPVRDAIYANPKLSSMKAIKNKQLYIVDYNYMFGYGYSTIDGMEALAKEMYPDLFK
ncbi:ABC transporter substrate-binding protein [Lysinibacillus piscis]|uniref:Metal ABC transporter substrate-binding protein n=1 Tax=Lysinibacillus piscis TaxID=2518931 RepID=A0ABQ5NPH4_9BACI|nr:ABC transporter substrate-binding protein [Lysinibacillus sp. KH24]GLC90224.1 metal ABC transporter substrate-binding protein [Lysinibacillus sp. KH24]